MRRHFAVIVVVVVIAVVHRIFVDPSIFRLAAARGRRGRADRGRGRHRRVSGARGRHRVPLLGPGVDGFLEVLLDRPVGTVVGHAGRRHGRARGRARGFLGRGRTAADDVVMVEERVHFQRYDRVDHVGRVGHRRAVRGRPRRDRLPSATGHGVRSHDVPTEVVVTGDRVCSPPVTDPIELLIR